MNTFFQKPVKLIVPILVVLSSFLVMGASGKTNATVIQVIDGDTIEAKYDGHTEHVRLIGIDTPEKRPNDKALKDSNRSHRDLSVIVEEGKKATKYTRNLIPKGSQVRLELDVEPRDKYGRLLAYVYLADGTFANEKIVRDGYASLLTYPPNVKYVSQFKKAFASARAEKLGLWAESDSALSAR